MQPSLQHHRLTAAVIDLDGTLVDTLGDFEWALNAMLGDLSLPAIDRVFIEHTVGQGSEHLIRRTLQHVGAGADVFPTAWESYLRHYLIVNGEHSAVYPGAEAGLQALAQRGLKLACLTNKPTALALPLLRQKNLMGYFQSVFGGDAFERKKPDPMPLLKTCEALASLPSATLMVGDSSNDAQAARAAGCPVVLVSYGYNHGQPIVEVDADGVIDRLDQLAAYF